MNGDFQIPAPKPNRARDDALIGKRKPLKLEADDECLSLENNTSYNRGKKKQKGDSLEGRTIKVRGSEKGSARQIDLQAFYAHSHFVIDTLRDDLCERRPDEWYEFKALLPEDPLEEQLAQFEEAGPEFKEPTPLFKITKVERKPKPLPSSLKTGKWSKKEHHLFLEALRLYGKNWEKIEQHVGTREAIHIRSHAQKYLIQLIDFIEGKQKVRGAITNITLEEAEFYYGTLNQRVHKFMHRAKPIFEIQGDANLAEFCKWQQSSSHRSQISHYSFKVKRSHGRFSFRSVLHCDQEESDDSTGSDFHTQFDLFPPCNNVMVDYSHRKAIANMFKQLPTIDSDDEDPSVVVVLEDCGIEFEILQNISNHSCMGVFHHVHVGKYHLNNPTFFKIVMAKVRDLIEQEDSPARCYSLGEFCVVLPHGHLRIDIEKVREFYERPKAEQRTGTYFKYQSPSRGLIQTKQYEIPYEISESSFCNIVELDQKMKEGQ